MSTKFKSFAAVTGLYRVTLVDQEPIEVTVIGADVMRWEQVNTKSFFAGDIGLSRIAWVVWAALKRQHLTELSVQDFLSQLVDLETEDDEAEDEEDEEAGDDVDLPNPTEAGIGV